MGRRSTYLEGNLTAEQFDRLQQSVTLDWDPDFVSSPESDSAIDDVVFRRHDNTVRFVVPWVDSVSPLKDSKVLDFGSGCGSSALAFSHFAREIEGFEIDQYSVEAFRARMKMFECSNAKVSLRSPEDILEAALDRVEPRTTVLFLAVIEHLTESERLDYLTRFWNRLTPGDVLVMAETPNYYAYFDGHTFGLPFSHMVPDAYFERWLESQPEDLRFRNDLLGLFKLDPDQALERRRRLGIGVSHHVFELAFETDLREVVVADGFSDEIVNWFPISSDDRSLIRSFRDYEIELPIGFARSVMAFVFRKPKSVSDANAALKWNRKQRSKVFRRYKRLL